MSVAEGGMLLFGDADGFISLTDRNFNHADRKSKAFRGPVCGLAYVFDSISHSKQFVIAIGDESRSNSSEATAVSTEASIPQYFIKVCYTI